MASKETGENTEMTVIGRGTTIRGEVDFEHGAKILGVFEGKIRSQGEVQIGETADCRAEIDAQRVVINGTLNGDITAHDRLRLSGTAHLTGDICATKLLVEEGASFVGHCRVGDAAAEDAVSRATTQAAASVPSPAPREQPTPTIATRVSPEQIDFKPPWRDRNEPEVEAVSRSAETGAA